MVKTTHAKPWPAARGEPERRSSMPKIPPHTAALHAVGVRAVSLGAEIEASDWRAAGVWRKAQALSLAVERVRALIRSGKSTEAIRSAWAAAREALEALERDLYSSLIEETPPSRRKLKSDVLDVLKKVSAAVDQHLFWVAEKRLTRGSKGTVETVH